MVLRLIRLAAALAVVLSLTVTGTAHAEPGGGLTALRTCLERLQHPALDVLLVLDASGSIKETDPLNQRLDAVQIALDELSRLGRPAQAGQVPIEVSVQRAVFSGGFHTLGAWERVDGNSGAAPFSTIVPDGVTDYQVALDQARQLLGSRAAQAPPDRPACQMLIWLTDGKYQPVNDNAPDLAARVTAGKAALCGADGVLDQLRGNGVAVVTVGLTKKLLGPDEAFLRQISGTEPGCGRPGGMPGIYLRADNPGQLAETFLQIAVFRNDRSEPCVSAGDGCTFTLEAGLHRFAALIEPGAAGSSVVLRPPAGGSGLALARPSSSGTVAGATLDWRWYGADDHALVIVHGQLSRTDPAWAGRWQAEFTGGGQGGGSVFLYGDETVRLDPDLVFRRNQPWTFAVHRQNADGGLPARPAGVSVPTIKVLITSPSDSSEPVQANSVTETADGWTVRFDAPRTWHGGRVDIGVQLTMLTSSGVDISPPPLVGRATVVSTVAVMPDPLQFPAIHGAGSTRSELTVRGGDQEQCVWIEGGGGNLATVTGVDPVRVSVEGAGANRDSCLKVPVNEERKLTLTATSTGRRGWTGLGRGKLIVTSVGPAGAVERTDILAAAPLSGRAVVKADVVLVWLTMLGLSALPLLLFALINMWLLPRFDRRDHLTAHYELCAADGRVELRRGGRWSPKDKDFAVMHHGRRRLDVGRIGLAMRVPWRHPFGTPEAIFRAASRASVQTQPIGDRPLDLVLVAGPPDGRLDDGPVDIDVSVVLDSRSSVTATVAEQIRDQTQRAVAALPRQRDPATARKHQP